VPEDKFDFRMVDNNERKSDSPRESLIHQIDVTRDYVNGIKTGRLNFKIVYPDLQNGKALYKGQLLILLEKSEKELISVLSDPKIENAVVAVPWSHESESVLSMIWALDSHETLHTGWNLAVMDHLGIERFPELKQMWGI